MFLGGRGVWVGGPHWGTGFWVWGGGAWAWNTARWWASPAYPGWVWVGEPWVWDGNKWLSQDGYWTTVDNPQVQPEGRALGAPAQEPEWPGAESPASE
jgi:hypothetical protein